MYNAYIHFQIDNIARYVAVRIFRFRAHVPLNPRTLCEFEKSFPFRPFFTLLFFFFYDYLRIFFLNLRISKFPLSWVFIVGFLFPFSFSQFSNPIDFLSLLLPLFHSRFQIQRSSILKGTLIINKRVTTSNKISRATINYQRNGRIYYNKATLKPDVSPRSSSLVFATTCVYA